jgi:hypothetical protein
MGTRSVTPKHLVRHTIQVPCEDREGIRQCDIMNGRHVLDERMAREKMDGMHAGSRESHVCVCGVYVCDSVYTCVRTCIELFAVASLA